MEQNQRVTPDDVERQIADALQRWDRAAAAERGRRRVEAERFSEVLFIHVAAGSAAFAGCWVVCGLLAANFAADPHGAGAFVFMTVAPFVLWLAGTATYARKAFGPKREDAP